MKEVSFGKSIDLYKLTIYIFVVKRGIAPTIPVWAPRANFLDDAFGGIESLEFSGAPFGGTDK